MMDPSAQRTSTTFWLLIAGSLFLLLLGLVLGWSRGVSGVSDHSARLAIITAVALFVFLLLTYLFAWRHEDGGGRRKLGSATVGTTLGVVVVIGSGLLLAATATNLLVLGGL